MTPIIMSALATQSRKLQNRVAEIVKALAFQGDETSDLMAATPALQSKDGQITQTAPVDFLDPQEQQVVLDDAGGLRVSLYKALLFIKIAEAHQRWCAQLAPFLQVSLVRRLLDFQTGLAGPA